MCGRSREIQRHTHSRSAERSSQKKTSLHLVSYNNSYGFKVGLKFVLLSLKGVNGVNITLKYQPLCYEISLIKSNYQKNDDTWTGFLRHIWPKRRPIKVDQLLNFEGILFRIFFAYTY